MPMFTRKALFLREKSKMRRFDRMKPSRPHRALLLRAVGSRHGCERPRTPLSHRVVELPGILRPRLAGACGSSPGRRAVAGAGALQGAAGPRSGCRVVLKIPDWGGASLIAPRDPRVGERERLIAEAGSRDACRWGSRWRRSWRSSGGTGGRGCGCAISALARRSVGARARRAGAAERCALLHELYLGAPDLRELPWLGREEYAAYAHHVPQARRNLDALAGDARWQDLLPADSIPRLREALDMERGWRRRCGACPRPSCTRLPHPQPGLLPGRLPAGHRLGKLRHRAAGL